MQRRSSDRSTTSASPIEAEGVEAEAVEAVEAPEDDAGKEPAAASPEKAPPIVDVPCVFEKRTWAEHPMWRCKTCGSDVFEDPETPAWLCRANQQQPVKET